MNTKSNIIVVFTIIAVGLVSFISGRLSSSKEAIISETSGAEKGSVKDLKVNPIQNPTSETPEVTIDESTSTTGNMSGENLFIASKNGKKYFPVSCGSSKTIKPENAIYFKSMAEAEQSGRTQSVQCKY